MKAVLQVEVVVVADARIVSVGQMILGVFLSETVMPGPQLGIQPHHRRLDLVQRRFPSLDAEQLPFNARVDLSVADGSMQLTQVSVCIWSRLGRQGEADLVVVNQLLVSGGVSILRPIVM